MQNTNIIAKLEVLRYDLNDDPVVESKTLSLRTEMTTAEIYSEIHNILQMSENDNKILKLRLHDGTLITAAAFLDENNWERPFRVEVTKIHQNLAAQHRSQLHSVYVDAVRSKIQAIDKRVRNVENLMPQIKLRREINNERTVNALSTKVAFLDKRLDDLTPQQWKSHQLS